MKRRKVDFKKLSIFDKEIKCFSFNVFFSKIGKEFLSFFPLANNSLYLCKKSFRVLKRIGIIVAMDKELAQLRAVLGDAREERHNGKVFVVGKLGGMEVVLQKCGIGKVNAAIGAVEMIDRYMPEVVISSGCAGGADVDLNVMDVVVASECAYHDVYCGDNAEYGQVLGQPARFAAPAELVGKALSIKMPEGMKIKSGLTVSGDWFVDSREKMRSILGRFPDAEAVDMESCAIAQTCHIYNVPFVSFRVISDVPLKDRKAAQYFDFWDRVSEDSFEVTRKFLDLLQS